ncbi:MULTISPECIES: phosphonate ABC transporter substrate-binding protein [Thalassospira]|jgi:phosphonate transport system substrate-binding protein|uniref:Phosphonate ABC transporter substrate-binding protein n=2 Tax=Thalassospira TaxID=168934 RepID=A0A8I1MBZ2_9PROT|nr:MULTISPECIES: phosphonate ABC transporter substrate-binding protein [Thalassospira]MEE3045986.1 phosphonate ABC transporter substrate-binding protein [Pseudomonadota bacterium]KZB59175.1 phosphonate ABC transporter substrate-binding protein [Thalassospira sp. MCCC 1A02491]MAL39037.1 phosphonate ABC transporter substrate-binding protein [Thalassospira sp.]MBN8198576.1 phosphonate ABC transporter substrate-binding protein [Thalassospira povalilytica]MBO6771301.1 phosphonate ABC transporter su|tara:strand:- start:883 stop:1899 length:1017 start_codon:yes stop_codon:yes gene_type:complete
MIAKTIASAALAATLLASGIAAADVEYKPLEQDPEKLVFGFISTESSSNLKAQWQPMIDDMEKALGKEIEAFFAPDYAGIIEGMRFGKVHVGWFGNKSAMEAVDRAGGEVFVQTSKSDGSNGYYSHIITQADNDKLNTLADMLKCDGSLNFGIGDPNSTSGFLVPTYYVFAQNGVDPKDCFKTVRNANHETNLMATANKQVDVAANNSEQLARTEMNKPEITEKVKVIWTSPLIPSDPMVYRKDLSRELKSEIKAFFLGYGRMGDVEGANKVLAGIQDGMGKFMESSNAQLYPIRQLELYKNKLKIQNTEELSADEKAARVAEIDKKLAELEILVSYE